MLKIVLFLLVMVVFGLPFLLQQDLWPLLRMGMFAQVAAPTLVTEHFGIRVNGQELDWSTYGLAPANAQHLMRKYWYQHQQQKMLSVVKQANSDTAAKTYVFFRCLEDKVIDSVVLELDTTAHSLRTTANE